ncbi:MAG: acetylxylan esterase [Luteolibacter sp.]|uniref:glucuronyl esterase domain-containing protein n=1 Tax=Luteolibacter sp. TaxID=1962973 RepID=UPI003263F6DD
MFPNPRLLVTAATLLMANPLFASDPPNPLAAPDGTLASSPNSWTEHVRHGTLLNFRQEVYGERPVAKPDDFKAVVVREDTKALDGVATMKEIEISYSGPGGKGKFPAVLFVPNSAKGPVPAFLLLNFIAADPALPGNVKGLWPVREIIARGYATVAFNFNDVDPDRIDGFKDGVRAIYGKQPPAADAWGALSAWGWGASRVLDYLETDKAIDAKRVAVLGHSRAGKAAVWCGAEDERFAMVISNNSGCSGAALARGKEGERVANITTKFPYWFCENYKKYADNEDNLPIDQHQLLGLIAPRLLYVASATEDQWADPKSEFKSCVLAAPVYALYDLKGLESNTMPPPDQAMQGGTIGYHLRTGKHDLAPSDWQHYMDFADKNWGKPGK